MARESQRAALARGARRSDRRRSCLHEEPAKHKSQEREGKAGSEVGWLLCLCTCKTGGASGLSGARGLGIGLLRTDRIRPAQHGARLLPDDTRGDRLRQTTSQGLENEIGKNKRGPFPGRRKSSPSVPLLLPTPGCVKGKTCPRRPSTPPPARRPTKSSLSSIALKRSRSRPWRTRTAGEKKGGGGKESGTGLFAERFCRVDG